MTWCLKEWRTERLPCFDMILRPWSVPDLDVWMNLWGNVARDKGNRSELSTVENETEDQSDQWLGLLADGNIRSWIWRWEVQQDRKLVRRAWSDRQPQRSSLDGWTARLAILKQTVAEGVISQELAHDGHVWPPSDQSWSFGLTIDIGRGGDHPDSKWAVSR